MSSLKRMTRNFALVLSTGVIFVLALGAGVQAKASWPTENSAGRIEHQQDPTTAQPTIRPLLDWLARANDLKVRGLVDLNSTTQFTVEANLNSDCRLSEIVIVQKSGDRRLFDVVGNLVAAVGDSNLLTFVGARGSGEAGSTPCIQTPLRFNFSGDSSEVAASIEFPEPTAERATLLTKGYNILIMTGRTARRGHPNELILNGLNAASDGKQVIVRFRASRTAVDELIARLIENSKT